jgi:L-aspartate oxidase
VPVAPGVGPHARVPAIGLSMPIAASPDVESVDLLVLGSGVAGLSAAIRAAGTHGMRVGVLTKGELAQSTTRWAQGGVAAVLGEDPDSTDLHLADTLVAGAGLCDPDAVRVLVDEGPGRVNELIALGAIFDRDEQGRLELAREGGHSLPRVVHAGGAATGAEIERALVEAVRQTVAAVHESSFALDLVAADGVCRGVVARDAGGRTRLVRATHVLLATGGTGQLFSVTTNPVESTGDGIAMALRAGAAVADAEFVQFHPTALHHPQMPRPLLSEALRGHGALIRDADGERFVDELQPRDVVARAMTRRMLDQRVDHLWLDATGLESFGERFPTISAALARVGLDPSTDWLPIAPAAHYFCGGVVTDLDGATSLPGLWAAGEAACSGVHGANRLASNSLLEGMVFGARVVEAIERGRTSAVATGAMRAVFDPDARDGHIGGLRVEGWSPARRALAVPDASDRSAAGRGPDPELVADDAASALHDLQRAMTEGAGVLRDASSLAATSGVVERLAAALPTPETAPAFCELANLVEVARALLAGATTRTESRGAHTRADHPDTDPAFRRRVVLVPAPAPQPVAAHRDGSTG